MLVTLVWRVLVYNSQNLSRRLCFIDKHVKHRSVVPQTPVSDSQRFFGMKERRVCNFPVLLRSRPLKIIHGFLSVGIPDNDLPVGAWSNASVFGKVNECWRDKQQHSSTEIHRDLLNPCTGLIVVGSSSNLQMQRTCSSCTSTTSALLQQHRLLWQNNLRSGDSMLMFLSTGLFCEGGQHLGLLYA